VGPFTVGLLYDATGDWTVPLIMMISLVAPMVVLASYVGRPIYLEDQLPTPADVR
jgi:CP family cyanate transporter-like MFS transporter